MKNYIPSTTRLRAFEATARHLSFTRAANELNITQTAVSHQIKGLEEFLGVKLFTRDGNLIQLSEAGHRYLKAILPAILEISNASRYTIDHNDSNVLKIASLVTFGLKCLIPHLEDFRRQHPEISLRISTVPSFDHIHRQDYDLSIQYGNGHWPGMAAARICTEECFPVCSPALLEGANTLTAPSGIAKQTIIRTSSLALREDWQEWLEAAGVKDASLQNEIVCDYLFASVQAATDGLGVLMGRTAVVSADLRAGRLVEPFDVRLPSTSGYYIVKNVERSSQRSVRLFEEWLIDHVGQQLLDTTPVPALPPAGATPRASTLRGRAPSSAQIPEPHGLPIAPQRRARPSLP